MGFMEIYGRDGQLSSLSEDDFNAIPWKKRVLARKMLILDREPVTVLTMWDGVDITGGEAPKPCPFSTLVMSESSPSMLVAVATERQAIMSHEMMVGMVRSHGGRSGWRIPVHFLTRAYSKPASVKYAWVMTIVWAALLLFQMSSITLSALTGTFGLVDAFGGLVAMFDGWMFWRALQGLKYKRREVAEERRTAKDNEAFEEIVRQIK